MSLRQRLEDLLAGGTDNAQLRFGLASACMAEGAPDEALVHAELAVVLDADYSAAWRLLGQVRLKLGHAAEAGDAFRRGIEVAERRGDQQLVRQLGIMLD